MSTLTAGYIKTDGDILGMQECFISRVREHIDMLADIEEDYGRGSNRWNEMPTALN